MGTIKTEEIIFNGRKIKRKILCDSKGIFSTTLPDEVVKLLALRSDKIADTSMDKLLRSWDKKISEFVSAKTTTRKVIVCSFKSAAYIVRDDVCVYKKDDISFTNGIALDFTAGVYIETTVKQDGKNNHLNYEYEESSIPNSAGGGSTLSFRDVSSGPNQVLEWTPEREAAIAGLVTHFENLIMRLDDIFSNEHKLLKIIQNSGNLLSSGK